MKPIIIFKEKNKNGKYEFTEKEFKEFLEKAYDEGYKEGKRASTLIAYPSLNPAPYTTPTHPSPNGTGDKPWWDYQITSGPNPKLSPEFASVTSKPDPNITITSKI
jgi:hypothetical protein